MPLGVGSEWIAFSLGPPGPPRRIDRVNMSIPAMPLGPLSVREFHLEESASADGPWTRASRTLSTLNVGTEQSWAIDPPIESSFVRIVCTRNASRARCDEDRARWTRAGGLGPALESCDERVRSMRRVSASVGFFYVSFGTDPPLFSAPMVIRMR